MTRPSLALRARRVALVSLAGAAALAAGCSDEILRSGPVGVSAEPSRLDFGYVQVGGEATLPVSLVGVSGDGTNFVANPTQGRGFSVELDPDQPPGNEIRWLVTFAPTQERTVSGTLAIFSNDFDATVLLSGFGVRANWALEPEAVDFGSVVLGSDAEASVTVTNEGERAFAPFVRGIPCRPDEADLFCYSLADGVIEPGDALTMTVRFVPTTSAAVNRTYAVGDVELPLTGRGVGP